MKNSFDYLYIYLYLLYDHCYSIFKYSNIYQFFQFMIGFNSHYHSILSCAFIVHNFFYICSRIINNFSNMLISNMQVQIKLLLTSYHSHVIIITNAIINSFDNLERFNDRLIHSQLSYYDVLYRQVKRDSLSHCKDCDEG